MAYSNDLRTRAVAHFLQETVDYRGTASLFKIGAATLHRWVERHRERGDSKPFKSTGRPRTIPITRDSILIEFVLLNADSPLRVLSEKWHEQHGQKLSISTISRSIRRAGLSFKKKRFVPQSENLKTSAKG